MPTRPAAAALSPRPPADAQPSATSAAAAAGDNDGEQSSRTCRICWGGDVSSSSSIDDAAQINAGAGVEAAANKLVSPCSCKGTCELVHLGCLKSWLVASARAGKKPSSLARCELCGAEWRRGVVEAICGAGRGLLRRRRPPLCPPRLRLRAAAEGAGKMLSGLARACASAVSGAARRARDSASPADAALALYAAALAARGAAAAGRGAGRGAARGARVAREVASAGHVKECLRELPEFLFVGLCANGFRVSRLLPTLALSGVRLVLPLAIPVAWGLSRGLVAGAAAGVGGDLQRHASGVKKIARGLGGRLAGAAALLSRGVASSRRRPSSSSSNADAAVAAIGAAAASAAATTAAAAPPPPAAAAPAPSARSLSARLAPLLSPPLSSLAPSRHPRDDVGLWLCEEERSGGFLSSLAASLVTAVREREAALRV